MLFLGHALRHSHLLSHIGWHHISIEHIRQALYDKLKGQAILCIGMKTGSCYSKLSQHLHEIAHAVVQCVLTVMV